MSDENWENNEAQFARLICEIMAVQESLDFAGLCASMDLSEEELQELLDRAHKVWEVAKIENDAPLRDIVGADVVIGSNGRWLVLLICGHKKFVGKKLSQYHCLQCKELYKST